MHMNKILFCLIALFNHCLLFAAAQESIFKEYDIRGIVGKEFEVEDASEMASAIGTYFLQKDASIKRILVGADGRVHSPFIKSNIITALISMGLDVVDIGTCTTPIVCFGLYTIPVDAGLMITASHNSGEYNGIKIFLGKSSVSGQEIKKIRDLYNSKQFMNTGEKKGTYKEEKLIACYVECIKSLFPKLVGSPIRAIIDCGNGAAGTVMPLLVDQMQWKHVSLLYPEVDGTYPHHIADPTVEKYMDDLKKELLNSNAELGLGFDGDCDRMAPMTTSGRLVKGDQLVTILSKAILEKHPGSSIIFDVSSSQALLKDVKRWGGNAFISATGTAQIKKKMTETDALLGGEISCHTIFKDRYFGFDDGIYSMMRLFELLQDSNRSLDEWLSDLTPAFSSPAYRIPCPAPLCQKIIDALHQHFSNRSDAELILVDGLRIHLPYGWAIVRSSKTEPVISIRLEGNTEEDLLHIKREFYALIKPHLNCPTLLD